MRYAIHNMQYARMYITGLVQIFQILNQTICVEFYIYKPNQLINLGFFEFLNLEFFGLNWIFWISNQTICFKYINQNKLINLRFFLDFLVKYSYKHIINLCSKYFFSSTKIQLSKVFHKKITQNMRLVMTLKGCTWLDWFWFSIIKPNHLYQIFQFINQTN